MKSLPNHLWKCQEFVIFRFILQLLNNLIYNLTYTINIYGVLTMVYLAKVIARIVV